MTTSTHSHKPWTDKGGHVTSFGLSGREWHILDVSNNPFEFKEMSAHEIARFERITRFAKTLGVCRT